MSDRPQPNESSRILHRVAFGATVGVVAADELDALRVVARLSHREWVIDVNGEAVMVAVGKVQPLMARRWERGD